MPKKKLTRNCQFCNKPLPHEKTKTRGAPRKYHVGCSKGAQSKKDSEAKRERRSKERLIKAIRDDRSKKEIGKLLAEWDEEGHRPGYFSSWVHSLSSGSVSPMVRYFDDSKPVRWTERQLTIFIKRFIEENKSWIKSIIKE